MAMDSTAAEMKKASLWSSLSWKQKDASRGEGEEAPLCKFEYCFKFSAAVRASDRKKANGQSIGWSSATELLMAFGD